MKHCDNLSLGRVFQRENVDVSDRRSYLQLTMKADSQGGVPTPNQAPKKRPIIRCDSESIAHKVRSTLYQGLVFFETTTLEQ